MTEVEREEIRGRSLLLYDGVCALCNGLVTFLMARDRGDRMRFAPLQSALGREMLARAGILSGASEVPDGVVLVERALTAEERVWQRSDAAVAALRVLGGGWKRLGWVLGAVPRGLREPVYKLVARLRYRLFGRYATCPLPRPEQRRRMLGLE